MRHQGRFLQNLNTAFRSLRLTHISLALVGLMWVFPFLHYRHQYPLTAFYQEWWSALLGVLALAPLASILPMGGVQRGWSVGVDGHGAWALAMGLAGWLMETDGWMAAVGLEDLGLVGAGEQGVALDRVLMVETPTPDQWATVVAALVEAMHVVCVRPHHRVARQEARRLQARAREQQAVLVHLDGGRAWPDPVDLSLTGRSQQWEGLGKGHGHLQGRRLLVEVGGRRAPGVDQWAEVQLDGPLVGASSR